MTPNQTPPPATASPFRKVLAAFSELEGLLAKSQELDAALAAAPDRSNSLHSELKRAQAQYEAASATLRERVREIEGHLLLANQRLHDSGARNRALKQSYESWAELLKREFDRAYSANRAMQEELRARTARLEALTAQNEQMRAQWTRERDGLAAQRGADHAARLELENLAGQNKHALARATDEIRAASARLEQAHKEGHSEKARLQSALESEKAKTLDQERRLASVQDALRAANEEKTVLNHRFEQARRAAAQDREHLAANATAERAKRVECEQHLAKLEYAYRQLRQDKVTLQSDMDQQLHEARRLREQLEAKLAQQVNVAVANASKIEEKLQSLQEQLVQARMEGDRARRDAARLKLERQMEPESEFPAEPAFDGKAVSAISIDC